jgi:hypothetical protein
LKKIKFIPQPIGIPTFNGQTEQIKLPAPIPAAKSIPEFYSKAKRWMGEENKPKILNYQVNHDVKACVSFLDSFTHGYFLTTWTDAQVNSIDETVSNINWLTTPDMITLRTAELATTLPIPAGHTNQQFAWIGQWGIEVPKGYSVLITHPLNRFDLPFTTLSGIIDGDTYHSAGNLPFFIKSGWEGVIPAGTPFAQVIPIKRDDWVSEIGTSKDINKIAQQAYDSRRVISGLYKKKYWSRKSFE